MKSLLVAATLAVAASTTFAQSGDMKGMDMKGMEMKGDMKGMDMSKGSMAKGPHKATGVVKKADAKAGTVTLDHEAVKSMNWPAMSMTFQVKDKALMDKFSQGKKVDVEFEQRGNEYVITSAK